MPFGRPVAFGEAIYLTCRPLEAPELKKQLRDPAAPLVLVVSDDLRRAPVRHRYDGIDDRTVEPKVRVEIGRATRRGWVYVPTAPLSSVRATV